MGVLVPLNTGCEGREQADLPQHSPHPCSVHGQIHPSAALVLVLSPLWLPTVSMWQASAQADSFQQMVAGVNKGMGIPAGIPGWTWRCCSSCPEGMAAKQAAPRAKAPKGTTAP